MGEKSVKKKQYILNTARKVFMEKGYSAVTMKDIVDACEISRGGLYLYFGSTDELFREVLKLESEETDDTFAGQIGENPTPSDILAVFLKEQKKELLHKGDSLTIAKYEYLFANSEIPRKDNYLRKQFETGVKVLTKLFESGNEAGEFSCEDPAGTARNFMYVIEGLKITSQTIGINEQTVDKELMFLMQGLGITN